MGWVIGGAAIAGFIFGYLTCLAGLAWARSSEARQRELEAEIPAEPASAGLSLSPIQFESVVRALMGASASSNHDGEGPIDLREPDALPSSASSLRHPSGSGRTPQGAPPDRL